MKIKILHIVTYLTALLLISGGAYLIHKPSSLIIPGALIYLDLFLGSIRSRGNNDPK